MVAQMVKNLPAMGEIQVWSLGQGDPLEKGMATHSSILAWRIPWTEEPGRLQSMGSQRRTQLSDSAFHFLSSMIETGFAWAWAQNPAPSLGFNSWLLYRKLKLPTQTPWVLSALCRERQDEEVERVNPRMFCTIWTRHFISQNLSFLVQWDDQGLSPGATVRNEWGHTSESTWLFWRFMETKTGSPDHLRSLLSVKWLHCPRSHPGGTGFVFHIMADPCYCNQNVTTENTQVLLLRIPHNKACATKKMVFQVDHACQCRCGFHSWVFPTHVRKIPLEKEMATPSSIFA